MGKIYKLRAEIKDFILEKKKVEPKLSCRQISIFILDKFQIKISKSSVNSIIKEAGLSMPVGRRQKKAKRRPAKVVLAQEEIKLLAPPVEVLLETKEEAPAEAPVEIEMPEETESTGVILLKAADYLIGGSHYITEALASRLNLPSSKLLPRVEALLYSFLDHPHKDISLELNELQEVDALSLDILRIISNVFQEVRCVRINLPDGSNFYLDGQFHTIWSTPQIPYDFSATLYNTRNCINKYFQKDNPLVLFMAPGYNTPTKEFFDFMLNLDSIERGVIKFALYGNKLEEIEALSVEKLKKRFFVFGLWPWQFGQFRKAKISKEFKPFYFEPLKKEFYLTDITLELLQPKVNKRVTLRGVAVKTSLTEKTRVIVLSNFSFQEIQPEELARAYLSHWPNLEEAFQDYSRKIELFTYTASSQRFFSLENLTLEQGADLDISARFNFYLKALDLYVKRHFLPLEYEDKDFPTIKERFYNLKTSLEKEKEYLLAIFQPPSGYPYLKDLGYALHRINEREIVFPDDKRLWCSIA